MDVFLQLGRECASSRVSLKPSTVSRFSELPVISLLVDLAVLAGPYAPQGPLTPWGEELWLLSEGS